MNVILGLKCRECGKEYEQGPLYICDLCFGPLEVIYDYDTIKMVFSRDKIKSRPANMWRYRELLPLDSDPSVGLQVGYTPLIKTDNLADALGATHVYVKNDAVNYPTLSFKDRVVAVALSKAKEFGFDTVACASTGNLANAVAAQAASSNLRSFVFMPADLEQGKILGSQVFGTNLIGIQGNYDQVNRLCSEIVGKYDWAFVNINLRPYYAEGSKTYGYEIVEQFGWKTPQHVVIPMAGGSLITKVWKAFKELALLGIISENNVHLYGAQAAGCAPIVTAVHEGQDLVKPVKPETIAKSLAIGNPADGYYAIKTIRESQGWAEAVSDDEIIEGMKLLAETEGIFTESAGGVTVAATQKLLRSGRIPPNESIVIAITGNGLKTQETLWGRVSEAKIISARLSEFDRLYNECYF